jgi:hypothetical protein
MITYSNKRFKLNEIDQPTEKIEETMIGFWEELVKLCSNSVIERMM